MLAYNQGPLIAFLSPDSRGRAYFEPALCFEHPVGYAHARCFVLRHLIKFVCSCSKFLFDFIEIRKVIIFDDENNI